MFHFINMETKNVSTAKPDQEDSKYSIGNTVNRVRESLGQQKTPVGKGIESQIAAVLTQTALRRLPPPFNFVAPMVAEKLIMKYGIQEGRELLLKGLYWVKKVTEDDEQEVVPGTPPVR